MLLKKRHLISAALIFITLVVLGILIFSSGEKEKIKSGVDTKQANSIREGIYEGEIAPDFTLKDLNGVEKSLKEFRGKVVLLNFWATWCSPCRIEIPSMVKLYKKYKDRGLEIIGVNLDKLGRSGVEQFSKEYNISFPVLLDPAGEVGTNYGIVALPTTFILDRKGKILERVTGGLDWTTEENLKKFETILAESE
ncbi:MAG: TlpA disulfide reductase family protein [candidate division Zixibacteria bacterium]|nr:TlpA disulfide reductase family protein [candidate division Zixibacteria bacterium]